MKKLLFSISLILTTCLFSEDPSWITYHQQAIQCAASDLYQAVLRYTDAINSLPDKKDPKTLFLYLERGTILLDNNCPNAAFRDFNHVLFTLVPHDVLMLEEAKKLSPEKLDLFCRTLHERLRYFALIDDTEHFFPEWEALQQIDPRKPVLLDMGDGILVAKNFPAEEVKDTTDLMLKLELIEKSEDVQYSPSGVLTVKSKQQCSIDDEDGEELEELLEKGKKKDKKEEMSEEDKLPSNISSTMQQHLIEIRVAHCKNQCDTIFETCGFLLKKMPKAKIAAGAYFALSQIRDLCHQCCEGKNGFYRTCVKPLIRKLAELKGAFQIHDDPAFNDRLDDALTDKRDEYERQHKEYWDRIYKH